MTPNRHQRIHAVSLCLHHSRLMSRPYPASDLRFSTTSSSSGASRTPTTLFCRACAREARQVEWPRRRAPPADPRLVLNNAYDMRSELPSGTVTFLFTDIEGSTQLLRALGPEAYARGTCRAPQPVTRGIHSARPASRSTRRATRCLSPSRPPQAAASAAHDGQNALSRGPIRVRMGLHTGAPIVTAEGYVGMDVHRGARVAALAHGGQVLLHRGDRGAAGRCEAHRSRPAPAEGLRWPGAAAAAWP